MDIRASRPLDRSIILDVLARGESLEVEATSAFVVAQPTAKAVPSRPRREGQKTIAAFFLTARKNYYQTLVLSNNLEINN